MGLEGVIINAPTSRVVTSRGGGILALGAIAAALWSVFMAGAIWLAGGKLTEGLGGLLVGAVVVVVVLFISALALILGAVLLGTTAN